MNDQWTSWKRFFQDEKLQSFHTFPGIYAFAIIDLDISDQPFSVLKEIVYVGMSNNANGGLQTRLKQFKNTIELKPAQHGGAERFLYDYKEGRKKLEKTLFISVLYVECDPCSNNADDLRKMGKVCNLEYEYWARYVEKFGRLPKYNDKKDSPKN
jgi:hypothetical protein